MLYKRNIPETKQSTFVAFISNSLSLGDHPTNHILVRQELSKTDDKRDPWIQGHMMSIDSSWRWIMQKNLIQCNSFLQWFIGINSSLMFSACSKEKFDKTLKVSELGHLRRSSVGGRENSKVDFKLIPEKMESIFSVLEETDKKHDSNIMPNRIRFNTASELAKIAWKIQFQVGYLCPFFQGNWISARLLTNTLRVHWSLPWLTFDYAKENEEEDVGREYQIEAQRWFELFDEEGVLTDKYLPFVL